MRLITRNSNAELSQPGLPVNRLSRQRPRADLLVFLIGRLAFLLLGESAERTSWTSKFE